jgi:hypothetical protein
LPAKSRKNRNVFSRKIENLAAGGQQYLTQSLVHAVGGVPSHGGYPGRAAIKSHGYAGVAQKMQNQFRVNAAPQKQSGARVPEVVPANIAKPCALQQGLEVPVDDVQGVYRRADSAEHEAVIPSITASCGNIESWGSLKA